MGLGVLRSCTLVTCPTDTPGGLGGQHLWQIFTVGSISFHMRLGLGRGLRIPLIFLPAVLLAAVALGRFNPFGFLTPQAPDWGLPLSPPLLR